MIILDEYEKKVCRLAIQIVENESVLGQQSVSNDDAVNAENLLEELRPQYDDLAAQYPKSYDALKRKLVDL